MVDLPLRTSLGKKNIVDEYFDYKIILAYSNRLIFFESDQEPTFKREKPPKSFLRTVYFEEISMDCGPSGDKICTGSEFSQKFQNFNFGKDIEKHLSSGGLLINKRE